MSGVCTRASLRLARARYDFAGFGLAFLLESTAADGLVSDFFCTALCFGRGAWLGFGLFALRPGVLVAFALLPMLSRPRRTQLLGVRRRRQSSDGRASLARPHASLCHLITTRCNEWSGPLLPYKATPSRGDTHNGAPSRRLRGYTDRELIRLGDLLRRQRLRHFRFTGVSQRRGV